MDRITKIKNKFPEKARLFFGAMSREELMNYYSLNLEIDLKAIEKVEELILKLFDLFPDKCKRCGNCCKTESVQISNEEELRYAKIKGKDFFDMIDENLISPHFKKPCGFLKDNCCQINDIKPKVCKLYPFNFGLFDFRFARLELCPLGESIFKELYPISKKEQEKEMKKLGLSEERVNEITNEKFGDIYYLTKRIRSMTGDNYGNGSKSLYKTFTFPREDIELLYKKLKKDGRSKRLGDMRCGEFCLVR